MALRKIKYLLVILLLLLPIKNLAQNESIYFVEREADCGIISKEIKSVTKQFTLMNESNQNITIASYKTGCGCTTVSYNKRKIEPNDSIKFYVTVKTEHKWGRFEENVLVRISPNNIPFVLCIKGIKEYAVVQ